MLADYDIRSATSGSVSRSAGSAATTAPTSPTPGHATAPERRGSCPVVPAVPAQLTPGRPEQRDGSSRPSRKAVPRLTCDGTAGTAVPPPRCHKRRCCMSMSKTSPIGSRTTNGMLTVEQILEDLGDVSRRTFYEWRAKGTGPKCVKLPNGELRVRRAEYERWLAEREAAA